MRAKRSKKYRKLMHQYELTFGFREPYQVLGTLKLGASMQTLANARLNSGLEFPRQCRFFQDGLDPCS